MKTQAILFDLDGTLADSRPGLISSIEAAVRSLGHSPDENLDLNFVLGPPIDTTMARVLQHYGDDRVEEALRIFRGHQAEQGIFESALYEGIETLLSTLLENGVKPFVATSKRVELAKVKLRHLGVANIFAGIYGSLPDGSLNDKTLLIADVVEREELNPALTVMVGDRSFDMIGAVANSLVGIGAGWGYGTTAELEESGATAIAPLPQEVWGIIGKIG